MAAEIAPSRLAIATCLVLCACQSNWTPRELDEVHRRCAERPFDPAKASPAGVVFRPHQPAGTPVVIYGASWCHACDAAVAYLARRQIPFIEKDIENDKAASTELLAKLTDAGLASADGLPVLDVRGTVTVGFYPCVLEAAWAAH